MLKLLLTLAIIVIALMWWFGKGRAKPRRREAPPGSASPPASRAVPMVECAHCGLHLPRSDALEGEGGRYFCGAPHRRLGPAPGP